MSNIVLKFPVYKLETGNWKNIRFTKWKLEILRFPFDPELSRNSGLRNKFPDHSISKMAIFPEKWKP